MTAIPIGAKSRFSIIPTVNDLASLAGNPGVSVVSTTSIIRFLEQASHLAIQPYFRSEEVSVGTRVNVEHLATARHAIEVICSARVTGIAGRRVTFEIGAEQRGRAVMSGTHERAIVERSRFAPTASDDLQSGGAVEKKTVAFWFDFHSPWAYLAATRVKDVASRHNADVAWRPLHLANLIDRIDGRRVLDQNKRFLNWFMRDMQDWADLYGIAIRYHPQYPLRPSRALRASLYAASVGMASSFVVRVMRAYWEEAEDISDLGVLGRLAADVGMSSDAIVSAAGSDIFKAQLEANLDEAVACGIFGVPSFVLDGRIYFGNDRLLMLDRHLGGDTINRFSAGLTF